MKRYILSIFIAVLFIVGVAVPVLAVEPPDTIEIVDVKVFQNLAETGDSLYVFEYNIEYDGFYTSDNYTTLPVATDTFVFRLYDSDGTTIKSSQTPYVFPYFETSGYYYGVSAFYFSASDNASTWGDAVSIMIYGWPVYFSPAQSGSYTLNAADYSTATDQTDSRTELAEYIMLLSDRLTSKYSDKDIILKTSSDAGIVLSTYGELYFRGAIQGLQELCPELFFIQVYVPERMDSGITYNMTLQDTYTTRLDTDDIGRGFTRIGSAMGVSKSVAATGICFILCMVSCVLTARAGWGVEVGMGISVLIATLFALVVGDIVFTLLMIGALIAALGLAYLFLIRRSA